MRRLQPAAARDLLLVALTFSSGAVDAISFLALGQVFTAFMTGNVVFLGMRVAGAGGPDVVAVIAALVAFAAGVFLATRIVRPSRGSDQTWPDRVTLTLAVAAIVQTVFLTIWAAVGGRPSGETADVLIAVSSLAMGLQSGAVLSLGVRGVFTTAATATVMFFASDLAGSDSSAAERRRLPAVLVALLAGATAGGLLVVHARDWAPILPLAATLLVVLVASGSVRRAAGSDGPDPRGRPR
jgi:uncharacterized membrane protein YoaK (UPF0700 family)